MRNGKRTYTNFTSAQLKLIQKNNGKITLKELSELLEINYSNLSGALSYHKIVFEPFRKKRISRCVDDSKMTKEFNEEGEALLTDEIMINYSYGSNSN